MLQGSSWQRYVHWLMGCALPIWVVEAKCQEGGPTFWFWINRAPVSDTGLVYGGLRTSTPEADTHQMQPDYVYTAPTIKLVRIEQNATIIKNSYDLLHQTNSTVALDLQYVSYLPLTWNDDIELLCQCRSISLVSWWINLTQQLVSVALIKPVIVVHNLNIQRLKPWPL